MTRRLSKELFTRNLRVEFSIANGYFILDDKATFLNAIRCLFYVRHTLTHKCAYALNVKPEQFIIIGRRECVI